MLRGLHFQNPPFEQSKLIRVSEGKIQDVIVDIRKDSSTFGQYVTEILSKDNGKQIFIPKGFAHGFLTLSKTAIVNYKVDNYYSKDDESGISGSLPSVEYKTSNLLYLNLASNKISGSVPASLENLDYWKLVLSK